MLKKRDVLKLALASAVIVGSIAFSSPSYSAVVNVDNGNDDRQTYDTSIRNGNLYQSGNIINIVNDIVLTDDLPTISDRQDVTIQSSDGNHFTVDGNTTFDRDGNIDNFNYGYIINNSSVNINNLTFDKMGHSIGLAENVSNVYGAALNIQDANSVVNLSNVNITNSSLNAVTTTAFGLARNAYGGAIYNNGSELTISGSNISNSSIVASETEALTSAGNAFGGAIYNIGNGLRIDTTSFTGNTASTDGDGGSALGGAIYSSGDVTLGGGVEFSGNSDGAGANDIYFQSGGLIVNGLKSENANVISSGLASAGTSSVTVTDNGKLILNGDNRRFTGNAVVGENSSLTYGGTISNSILAQTNVTGNNGTVEFDFDDQRYDGLDAGMITTAAGVSGHFVKSGSGTLVLDSGDYSGFSGDVTVNGGTLEFSGTNYFSNASSNTVNTGASLIYTSSTDNTMSNLQGGGNFTKNGSGDLTLTGNDTNKFTGNAVINGGDLIANYENGTFFAPSATVNLNSSGLQYTTLNANNLSGGTFSSINLADGAVFNYTAEAGTTTIGNFYTSGNGNNSLVFNGSDTANFVLNNNFSKNGTGTDTITFNNADIALGNVSSISNNLVLNNSLIDLMDSQNRFNLTKLEINNLVATGDSRFNIDIFVNTETSDRIIVNSGSGILNIRELSFNQDFGIKDNFTVQVIENNNGSTVALTADSEINPQVAGWSTNMYEYEINAARSDGSSVYDSLNFEAQEATPNSLKIMNNYTLAPTRGFSLLEGAPVYNIAQDLEKTEPGTFTVNGISAEESIISGYRLSYVENPDGTIAYYNRDANGDYIVTQDRGSFFELTDQDETTDFTLENITIQDAARTNQDIKDGSVIYSSSDLASITVDSTNIKNNTSSGNGGAFDIQAANSVVIRDSVFDGNSSTGGAGGAIRSFADLYLSNTSFTNNTDSTGKNDIALGVGAGIRYNVDSGIVSELNGGISGGSGGTFEKIGTGTLNISGVNENYQGNILLTSGNIVYTAKDATDSFFENSDISISNGTSLTIDTSDKTDLAASDISGEGTLIKAGSETLNVSGNNENFKGEIRVNGGELAYKADTDSTRFFNSSSITLAGDTVLSVDTNGMQNQTGGRIFSEDNTAVFNKNGAGDFNLVGYNGDFTGTANINEGSLSFEKTYGSEYFSGQTNIAQGAVLNYTTELVNDAISNIAGTGTINKLGSNVLDMTDYTFSGTVNIQNGRFNAISSNENADDLDFNANVGSGTYLSYTAGDGSSVTLGGNGSKLAFTTQNSNATAEISDANVRLDIIENVTGNNVIINNSSSTTLAVQDYTGGNYTVNNSTFKLLNDQIRDYTFSSLTANNDSTEIDISLANTPSADNFTVENGSGVISISNFTLYGDSKLPDPIIPGETTKTVQVIHNGANSSISLIDTTNPDDIDTSLGAWATSYYEYNIDAGKSDAANEYYDTLEFLIAQETDPNTLKKMNQYKLGADDEGEKLRGFTVVENTDNPYNIAQDLETTAKGTFKVQGAGKNESIISGQRVEYTVNPDGTVQYSQNPDGTYKLSDNYGSFFEVTQASTNLQVNDLTIKDAQRTEQNIKDGSVLYMTQSSASFNNVLLDNNYAAGNGGAIAVAGGNLSLTNTDLINNEAGGNGGALYISKQNGVTPISSSSITGNTAGGNGGAIYIVGGGIRFSGTNDISSNHADGSGGAIYNDYGTFEISGTNTYSNNTSDSEGGAIYNNNGTINLSGTNTFSENVSDGTGGAIYNGTGTLNIADGTSFENNSSTNGNGGAIYNNGTGTLTNTEFISNNAQNGSAIYNDTNGSLTLTNPVFNGNLGNSYLYNNGTITLDAQNTLNLQNNTAAGIINNNKLNFNGTINVYDTIAAETGRGTIDVNGNTSLYNTVTDQNINIVSGNLAIGQSGNTNTDAILNNVNLVINENTTATLNNNFVNGGSITTNGIFNIVNPDDITISSNMSGSGTVNKSEAGLLTLNGKSNAGFNGTLNVNSGTVLFEKTPDNTFFSSNAKINVDNAEFDYNTTDSAYEFSGSNFSKTTLTNGGTLSISGQSSNTSNFVLNSGWLTSANADNQLIFSNANYVIQSAFLDEGNSGDIAFNSSIVDFAADDNQTAVGNYNTGNFNYTLNNSTLDVSNTIAGDTYNFNELNFENGSQLGLDVDLVLDTDNNVRPYGDIINANSGSGVVEITKLYITDDNGRFIQEGDQLSKGIIKVFDGTNNLKVAEQNDARILSWATNVYRYGITSAQTDRESDSIKIIVDGYSNFDTLRDMNIYDPDNNGEGGNRGFSFISGLESTPYYIYRDLDTTSKGTFTVLGSINADGQKSILSGILKPLEITQDDAGERLTVNPDGSITFDGVTLQQGEYTTSTRTGIDGTVETVYNLPTSAFSGEQTNGSMFEIINETEFSMENVLVQDAKRYASDNIKDGAVVYAKNENATVSLSGVDFSNNSVEGGYGGVIANYLSKEFSINGSTISSNSAALNGGAIYNTSDGFTIINAVLDSNSAKDGYGGAIYTNKDIRIADSSFGTTGLNTHQNGIANDIYIDGSANVTYEATTGTTNYINSGLAGTGSFTKTGAGILNLAGNNKDLTGNFAINQGELIFTADSADDSFVSAASTSVDGVLTMNIADTLSSSINNLSGGGTVNKNSTGSLTLTGDNSGYNGQFNINGGTAYFTKNSDTDYISGTTSVAQGAVLDYMANADDTLNNISGEGLLIKNGDAVLNVNGQNSNAFDINMQINSGKLNYTAAENGNITIGSNVIPSVSFGSQNTNASLQLNNGTYTLESELVNSLGNNIIFDSAEIKLAADNYTDGNYTIQNSVINLINDGLAETKTFNNLTTTDSTLKIDVNLTEPADTTDRLVANNGGGDIQLVLTEINLNDNDLPKFDNGLMVPERVINVLGGNLTFNNEDSISGWATDAYIYDVSAVGQDLILTAIAANDDNSLKAMNQFKQNEGGGIRGFQFNDENRGTYIIREDLGTTSQGAFTVNGLADGSTVISGEDANGDASKSFFEVTQDTDLTVNNVTIENAYADDRGGSVVIADNENVNVVLNNVNINSSSSAGDGGAINNTNSNSFTISGSNMSNITSDGKGGAIYTKDSMTIVDSSFGTDGVNTHQNAEQNDIYIEGTDTTVNFVTNTDSDIASGLAGDGILNKFGSETLNLSGNNEDFTGNLNVAEGTLSFEQNSADDTYISGNTNIEQAGTVNINANETDITPGTFSGAGTLNKNGENNLIITGDNSGFKGQTNINEGEIVFNAETSSDKYFSGSTNITENGALTVNAGQNVSVSNISGTGTINKNGSGSIVFSGNNSGFNGDLNMNAGELALASGALLGQINSATFEDGTSINLQNTSVIDHGNWHYTTDPNPSSIEHLSFNQLTLNGDVGFNIDVDLKAQAADSIYANEILGDGRLVIGGNSLNVVSDTIIKDSIIQIASGAFTDPAYSGRIILDPSVTSVMGPVQRYDVAYSNGALSFSRQGGLHPSLDMVNPAALASSVATQVGGYLTQLQTLHAGFYHMERYTKYPYMLRLTAESVNKNAISDTPVYQKSTLPETSSAMWVQPYTTFEQVHLRGGLDVSNVAYGAIYGGDSDLVDLGHGFKGVISTFVGYNGAHQSFNGVSMNQQGGTLGVTGTLYKGNFFTGLTVSTGASAGEAYTMYGTDSFAMITAGAASKTGYNWEIKDGRLIIQPSLFLGYTFVNTFDYTNVAGVKMDSDPLNAIQIVPGLKIIGNLKNGWQPYLGVNMVWSIMDKTNVMANDVRLPQLSVKPYVEYGVGVQKSWGERFTAFFQTMLRNGGRTGVALTAGFRWSIGKDPSKENVTKPVTKKVVKSL